MDIQGRELPRRGLLGNSVMVYTRMLWGDMKLSKKRVIIGGDVL
jgi:hypothetical protein